MKKRSLFLISIFSVAILFTACNPDPVEFKGISDAEVLSSDGDNIEVRADAILFNPNKYSGKIKDVDIEVFHNNKSLAKVEEVDGTKLKGNAESTIPLLVNLDVNTINNNILNNLIAIFQARKLELKYKGTIRVSVSGIGYTIPVDQTEELRF